MKSASWSPEDDERLRNPARSGLSLVEIAYEIQRSKSSVYTRAVKLKIAIARRNPMQVFLILLAAVLTAALLHHILEGGFSPESRS
jgi:hypothetical protein